MLQTTCIRDQPNLSETSCIEGHVRDCRCWAVVEPVLQTAGRKGGEWIIVQLQRRATFPSSRRALPVNQSSGLCGLPLDHGESKKGCRALPVNQSSGSVYEKGCRALPVKCFPGVLGDASAKKHSFRGLRRLFRGAVRLVSSLGNVRWTLYIGTSRSRNVVQKHTFSPLESLVHLAARLAKAVEPCR